MVTVGVLPVVLLLLLLTGCVADNSGTTGGATSAAAANSGAPAQGSQAPTVVDTIVEGLETPWGLAFLPDATAIVTERDTRRVLTVRDGRTTVVGTVEPAVPRGEAGLLGVAVSPTFDTDRLVFFYFTTSSDNRVVRTTLRDGALGELDAILDGIPAGSVHDGGRLAFGPDGYLYVSTGEAGDRDLAQEPDSLGGKILRITADGRPAPGNPTPTSPVWSLGHRNVQGLAFDDRGTLWASEFGSSRSDELNRIHPGGNYGWPEAEGVGGREPYTDPQLTWGVSEASPSGLAYAQGRLWMASLRGQRLWRIDVTTGTAADPRDFFVGEYGRMRTVAFAPDGRLWVTTSNRDGRGSPGIGDDRILAVTVGAP